MSPVRPQRPSKQVVRYDHANDSKRHIKPGKVSEV